jgi:hypothetical protein
LTIDDELLKKYKEERKMEATATLEEVFAPKTDQELAKESWADEEAGLPGLKNSPRETPDQILIAFSPYPTCRPYNILPRYFSRFSGVNCDMDFSLKKYLESYTNKLSHELSC